jgi:hypothetical protein
MELCAAMQSEGSCPQFLRLHYEHEGLTSLKVTRIEDLADLEAEAVRKRRRDKEVSQVTAVVHQLDDASLLRPPRRRARVKQPPQVAGGGRAFGCQPEGDEAGAAEEQDEFAELLVEWDEELAAAAAPAAGDEETAMQQELLQAGLSTEELLQIQEDKGTASEDLSRAPAALQADPSSSTSCRPTAATEPAPPPPPPVPAVRIDRTNGRIFRTDEEPNRYLGRLTTIKANTPQEAFSVYCASHGCQIMRLVGRAPSQSALLAWFAEGTLLPPGKDPVVQRRHKAAFPEPAA